MKKVNSILLSLILVACFSSEVFAGTYKAYVSKKVPSEALIYENFNSASFKSVVFAKYYGLYKKADNTYIVYFSFDNRKGKVNRSATTGSLIRLENNQWIFESRSFMSGYQIMKQLKEKTK